MATEAVEARAARDLLLAPVLSGTPALFYSPAVDSGAADAGSAGTAEATAAGVGGEAVAGTAGVRDGVVGSATEAVTAAASSAVAGPALGELRPHVLRLRRLERAGVRQPIAALGPGTLVLTNAPELLAGTEPPPGCVVLTPAGLDADGGQQHAGATDRAPHADPTDRAPHAGPAARAPHTDPAARTPHTDPAARTPHTDPAARTPHTDPTDHAALAPSVASHPTRTESGRKPAMLPSPSDVEPSAAPAAAAPPPPPPRAIGPDALPETVAGHPVRHIRVILDARGGDPLPAAALELHELAFAAASRLADPIEDGGSFAVLALDPAAPAAAPVTGLFTGLLRALAADLPDGLVYGVVTDSADLPAGLELLERESATDRHLAVAHYRGGVRCEPVLSPEDDEPRGRPLPDNPVIVATGGGRGITAELVDQLGRLSRPSAIWLLGSGPAAGPEVLTELPAERPAALRQLMADHPGEKIAALNERYNRWRRTAERVRTIDRLAAAYGADRVHYRQCDVRVASDMRRIAADIAQVSGGADIIVHGAGVESAAALRRKTAAGFRAVRDVKVRGWLHLREAFAVHNPAVWLAISSVTTVVPRRGEADYISANEFLVQAAAYERATSGADVHALVSGLWTESGMVTHTQVKDAYLARKDNFTHLDDELGRRWFRTSLERRRDDELTPVWLGETEWRMLGASAPGLRAAGERPGGRGAFVRGGPVAGEDGGRVWEFDLELDAHPWLRDHRVDGQPTLPGTFLMEIAAEAAIRSGAGVARRPVAIVDAVFSRFVRAAEERWPRRLVVTGRGLGPRVEVSVSSPQRGPIPPLEYCRMTVLLADGRTEAPAPLPVARDLRAAADAYALPDSPVRLGGIFDSLRDQHASGEGGTALLHLPPPGGSGQLADFLLPALAMDSLLRATAAVTATPDRAAVPVPVRIDRFDLHSPGNDAALAELPDPVRLRYRLRPDRCEAVDGAGRLLFAFTGLTTRDKRAAALAGPGKEPR
nr:SDR family NAD(P)-dependent oxidoreductase [Streptomyces coryli]